MLNKKNFEKAIELKSELDSFRPISAEAEIRIMQKFRLDWNFHSSHIEGNLLTYGETKALLLFGQTANAKPLQDHVQMTGHDEAIKYIEDIIKQERPLTETFIRELHKLILKDPYEVDAITPDGKPTKKTIAIGSYKSTPNHVLTKTKEIFYFAKPEETPAEMEKLLNWYGKESKKRNIHPVVFASEFHYRFIRIHPFDDGNGRIARLLMNFILMQFGYPPAIIKTTDKDNYFAALQQADAGQIDFFFNYICEQVIHSLEIMIAGAKGEDIEEDDDIDKKIALMKTKLKSVKKIVEKSDKETNKVNNQIYIPFLKKIDTMFLKFVTLFDTYSYGLPVQNQSVLNMIARTFSKVELEEIIQQLSTLKGDTLRTIKANLNKFNSEDDSFNLIVFFKLKLEKKHYEIITEIRYEDRNNPVVDSIFNEMLSENELSDTPSPKIISFKKPYNWENDENEIKKLIKDISNGMMQLVEEGEKILAKKRNDLTHD